MRERLPRVRARTLVVGVALGGVLLIGLALLGGTGEVPAPFQQPALDRRGPASAIQPELRQALLTGEDLPPPVPAPEPRQPSVAPIAPVDPVVIHPAPPGPPPAGTPETGAITDLCRFLFEDGNRIARLWPTAPAESTSRQTERDGGKLDQVLGVFDGDRSAEAYRWLRESAGGCDRFEAKLTGGASVIMLLRELVPGREESGTADDSYILLLTLEDGTPAGWISLDRIGPVVSVLRQLGPGDDDEDIDRTRHAALHKLRALVGAR